MMTACIVHLYLTSCRKTPGAKAPEDIAINIKIKINNVRLSTLCVTPKPCPIRHKPLLRLSFLEYRCVSLSICVCGVR